MRKLHYNCCSFIPLFALFALLSFFIPKSFAQVDYSAVGPPGNSISTLDQIFSDQLRRMHDLRGRDQDYSGALTVLDELDEMREAGDLNNNQKYSLWQSYASTYQMMGEYLNTIPYYIEMLNLPELERNMGMKQNLLLTLGNQYMVLEKNDEAINIYSQYNALSKRVNRNVQYRIASAYYQVMQYENALPYAADAIKFHAGSSYEGTAPRAYYSLLNALYWTLEDYDSAAELLEEMVVLFDETDDSEMLEKLVENDNSPSPEVRDLAVKDHAPYLLPAITLSTESEMLPIYTEPFIYPEEALEQGVEGWAVVEFIVTEYGEVKNPEVVAAEPLNIFDKSSLTAISSFRFEPRVLNGERIRIAGARYVFRYEVSQ